AAGHGGRGAATPPLEPGARRRSGRRGTAGSRRLRAARSAPANTARADGRGRRSTLGAAERLGGGVAAAGRLERASPGAVHLDPVARLPVLAEQHCGAAERLVRLVDLASQRVTLGECPAR